MVTIPLMQSMMQPLGSRRRRGSIADRVLDVVLGEQPSSRLSFRRDQHDTGYMRLINHKAMHETFGLRGPDLGLRGAANVRRLNRDIVLFTADPYHLLLEVPFYRFLCIFVSIYLLTFSIFAAVYRTLCGPCDMGCTTYWDALFLSVETMMTIGYGVPDPTFKSCTWIVVVIVAQCMLGILYDATLLGIIYQRVSAGGQRSSTVLFSDKAVIKLVGEAHCFQFQVTEMRSKQLLECHVRCYVYTRPWSAEEGREAGLGLATMSHHLRLHPLRLDDPDDSLGAMVLLALPTAVVHRIDRWSPLCGALTGGAASAGDVSTSTSTFLGEPSPLIPPQRSSECDAGVRYGVACDVCGECFQRVEQLRRHVEYMGVTGPDRDPRHAALLGQLPREPTVEEARKHIQRFFEMQYVEVICVIDGIDPLTSCNVQARQSYTAEDIVWDASFADCIYEAKLLDGKPGLCVDFSRFHDLVED